MLLSNLLDSALLGPKIKSFSRFFSYGAVCVLRETQRERDAGPRPKEGRTEAAAEDEADRGCHRRRRSSQEGKKEEKNEPETIRVTFIDHGMPDQVTGIPPLKVRRHKNWKPERSAVLEK